MKKLTKKQYEQICKEYKGDVISEEYDDEQIQDLAKCVVDSEDEEAQQIIAYLKTKGIAKHNVAYHFADDIACS